MLEIKGPRVSYGTDAILNGVDLDVEHGETLAIIGESGTGKTTMALSIMRLADATLRGYICFKGVDLLKLQGEEMRHLRWSKIALVFQNPGASLSHRFTVLEAVREPLDIYGIGHRADRDAKAMQVLEEVGLPQSEDFLSRYPHQLSGGELQRVTIARALILNPQLLIADEPTALLDASVQAKILRLLLKLQEERGLAMLFITHDVAVARKVSDRIAVMLQEVRLLKKALWTGFWLGPRKTIPGACLRLLRLQVSPMRMMYREPIPFLARGLDY